jgi:hypothetical protein
MEIYIKTLSGCIQPLSFSEKEVSISIVKNITKRAGYDVCFFRENDGDEKSPLGDDEKVVNGEMLNIFYKMEEFTENDNFLFETMMEKKLEKFYETFKRFIVKHKAVVAGGSVLSIFGGYDMKDLDIYINYSEAKEFISSLFVNDCQLREINQAPAYDQSFFRKNNIICRCCMIYRNPTHIQFRRYISNNIDIDIMIVPDDIEIESVVTNFDLTFCQVWWDGVRLYSNNVSDIKTKRGFLNKDYIQSYISMNSFTINRIQKYKNRGFIINIDLSYSQEFPLCGGTIVINKQKKTIDSCTDVWPLSILFKYLLNHPSFSPRNDIVGSYYDKLIFNYFKVYESFKNRPEGQLRDVYTAIVRCCYISIKESLSKEYRDVYMSFFSEEIDGLNVDDLSQYNSIVELWIRNTLSEVLENLRLLTEERNVVRQSYRNIQ